MTFDKRLLSSLAALLCLATVASEGQVGPTPWDRVATGQSAPAAADTLEQLTAETAREVEELRGWRFKGPVRTQRASLAEARRHMEAALDKEFPPARLVPLEAMMRLTGLLPADGDYRAATLTMLESQVAGFYDPEAKALFLVDQPGTMPRFVLRTILAHELAHALDDQAFDLAALERTTGDTEDARLVTAAVAEGSASALMIHYATARLAAGQLDPAEMKAYLTQEMERAKLLETMPRGLNTLFASYICGAAFLTKKDLVALPATGEREIGENLAAALKDLPRSSEQIVHPDKYWDPAKRDEPVRVDDASVERWLKAAGRRVASRDTLGELQTAVLTEPRDSPKDLGKFMSATAWTNPGAIGWGGDRFYLLVSGGTDVLRHRDEGQDPAARAAGRPFPYDGGVWVTAWDTMADREEFLRALEKGWASADRASARLGQASAVVFFGVSPADRERLTAALAKAPPAFTKAGKEWKP